MISTRLFKSVLAVLPLAAFALPAGAQSFRVQCPTHTALHPLVNASGQVSTDTGAVGPFDRPNPHIKCQQISGGDGFATMGDGTQTYLFAFGPLSGLDQMVNGREGTVPAAVFNQSNLDSDGNVLDVVKIGAPFVGDKVDGVPWNGAIGLVPDTTLGPELTQTGDPNTGVTGGGLNQPLDGHVDPRLIMDVGVLNGNIPAPLIVIDEGDELFLTLTNVGQVMRPDLFEQHTVHFHGYPNASAFYDGVPDASVAINVGGSFTYYYLAPEPGTYMWHCHISPPEHLQMGMVGQIYVRPRQNTVGTGTSLLTALQTANAPTAVATKCAATDILCSSQTPSAADSLANQATVTAGDGFVSADPTKSARKYAYNDGDGSTRYDVEYPLQLHGFDPNFHFVGMTFNPESFADNKDKYFLINGRSYPDTVGGYACSTGDSLPACAGKASGTVVAGPMRTQGPDGVERASQEIPAVINIPVGGRALLRFSDLNVTEYHTLASLGIPMRVIGYNARLLRDEDGNDMAYDTNSITLGGGESLDVILDASNTAEYPVGGKYYLYTPQLDHLSNDAENFGGMMTEINICASVNPITKVCGN
jgi:FtsP/CotA-like multicopper oxidase with cupredoxin domain